MPLGMSWHDYNESLVERGRILFDLGFASSWKSELECMNEDKVGRPFDFPDSYIEFLGFIKVCVIQRSGFASYFLVVHQP